MHSTPKRHTITAALPYTNGPIHIGHLAGVYVPADMYARYLRCRNRDVVFICGSDEHGVAIAIKAKKEGKTPKEIIDHYHQMIEDSFAAFGISFDHYSRTSSSVHHATAKVFFLNLYENGKFQEETREQLYDPKADAFLADRFVVGTCPFCENAEAYGDQCESCGSSLNATDLINPTSTLTGVKPVLRKTKHWYLPLDTYEAFIKEWILEGHQSDWKANVYGQVKSWVENGLKSRAVTRDLDWGIPVPLKDANGKVLYVWFDAPIGYISATKEWAAKKGKDWQPYWKDSDTALIHFIGKDNIVFHCIIFPAMLHASGDFILPQNVPANEFLNLEGEKISTSKNWAVWLHEYLEDFPEKQDALRYTLAVTAPETKDNDFTWAEFQTRNNSELVAIYGNFINRVVVLTHKYFNGEVPVPNGFTQSDTEVLNRIAVHANRIGDAFEQFKFREATQELMQLARMGNKYLAEEEPWKIIKEKPERVRTILYTALQIATALSVVSEPILPFTAEKLRGILNISSKRMDWDQLLHETTLLPSKHSIEKPTLLFERIEDEAIQQQREKLVKKADAKSAVTIPPVKPPIDFADFEKLHLKIATVTAAKKVPKTKKLFQLEIAMGDDSRTVVSGIAQDFTPESLVDKKVVLLSNLEPRTLKGVESQGMLLLGQDTDGKQVLVIPESAATPEGLSIS